MMAELFQVGVNTIDYHFKEIYECGELDRDATIRKFRIVRYGLRIKITPEVSENRWIPGTANALMKPSGATWKDATPVLRAMVLPNLH
jgi:hypothetical protein